MDIMTAVKKVYGNYLGFTGRAGRAEFWWFVLFFVVAQVLLTIVGGIIGTGLPSTIFALASIVPMVAVGIRRAHDLGKPGWMFILFWLMIPHGTSGDNEYGADPLA